MRLSAMFCKKWQHVRGQHLFHPSVLPRHVDRRISRFLPYYREYANSWEGGLNCAAKVQVLVVTPPPLFFPEVDRKKGGGVTAGQYGTKHAHAGKRKCYCCICVCDMNIFFLPWQDSQRNCFVFLRLLCLQNDCLVLSVSL